MGKQPLRVVAVRLHLESVFWAPQHTKVLEIAESPVEVGQVIGDGWDSEGAGFVQPGEDHARCGGDLIAAFSFLMSCYRKDGVRVFMVVPSRRRRGCDHKSRTRNCLLGSRRGSFIMRW